jgi:hypothetical protein
MELSFDDVWTPVSLPQESTSENLREYVGATIAPSIVEHRGRHLREHLTE